MPFFGCNLKVKNTRYPRRLQQTKRKFSLAIPDVRSVQEACGYVLVVQAEGGGGSKQCKTQWGGVLHKDEESDMCHT